MRKSRLIIFAALEMETRAAAKALSIPFLPKSVLKHATAPIELHTIGMRAVRLPALLPSLSPSSADRIWMIGLAGALDPALRVGDLVIDFDPPAPTTPLATDASIRQGRIHTCDQLVAVPAEKRALFAQTRALAVDMEQRIVRDRLTPLGIGVVGIRSISDTADTPLDPALPRLIDASGRPKWPALAGALLRRPILVVPLIRLGRDSSRALRELAKAIACLAASDPAMSE